MSVPRAERRHFLSDTTIPLVKIVVQKNGENLESLCRCCNFATAFRRRVPEVEIDATTKKHTKSLLVGLQVEETYKNDVVKEDDSHGEKTNP